MFNQSSRACPYCGTQLVAGQRFCANCGATAIEDNYQKTERAKEEANPYMPASSTPNIYPTPPPTYVNPNPYVQEYQPTTGNYQTPAPDYAQPQDASRSVLKQIGCGIVVMLLLIAGLCIGGTILAVRWISTLPDSTTPTPVESTPTDSISIDSTPESYLPSSISTYNQTLDMTKISKPRVSSIDTSEIIYIKINPSK